MSTLAEILLLWRNPLFVKGVRSRLRLRHVAVGATLTLLLASFLFLLVYLTGTERGLVDPPMAARATLVPLLILQGLILMLLGTGSVASGIAVERDSGMLDFHRLTPRPTAAKIVGCLFGLPVREYLLFAGTLPFVGLAVTLGKIPFLKVLHLYVVFFSAVILYHLTGFVSGMIAARPRRASWIAQAAIVALYLFLPQLSTLGLTVFGYLTIIPAFRAILADDLGLGRRPLQRIAAAAGLTEDHAVPFFATAVNPTIYTLLLQGALAATFFVVVHRKWTREGRPALSKAYATALFAGLMVLLAGSLWPFLAGERQLAVLRSLPRALRGFPQIQISLCAFLVVATAAAVLLLHVVTPTRHARIAGLRRAQKRGPGRGLPIGSDAAPGAPVALVLAALVAAAYALLARATFASGALTGAPPAAALAAPAALAGLLILSAQAARETWDPRGFGLFLLLAWLMPSLAFLVASAAWNPSRLAAHLTIASPFTALYFSVAAVTGGTSVWEGAAHAPRLDVVDLTGSALGVHGLIALAMLRLRSREARAREAEAERPPGRDAP